jgi:hypothetical protein
VKSNTNKYLLQCTVIPIVRLTTTGFSQKTLKPITLGNQHEPDWGLGKERQDDTFFIFFRLLAVLTNNGAVLTLLSPRQERATNWSITKKERKREQKKKKSKAAEQPKNRAHVYSWVQQLCSASLYNYYPLPVNPGKPNPHFELVSKIFVHI